MTARAIAVQAGLGDGPVLLGPELDSLAPADLAQRLAAASPFRVTHPVDANMVFVAMDDAALKAVNAAGWAAYRFDDGSVRFVCSWQTTEALVDELAATLRAAA